MLKNSIKLIPARKELYRAKLVFYLFLISLAMFFAASMITYVIIRHQSMTGHPDALPGTAMAGGPEIYQSLTIPLTFWISTALLFIVSYLLQLSVWAVQKQQLSRMRLWLVWAMVGAIGFVLLQSMGMSDLWQQHFSQSDGSAKVFGMSFTLSFIHVLHVLGGMIFLGYVVYQSARDKYDHECHWEVDNCASYWHFLDVIWVCMLLTFVFTN